MNEGFELTGLMEMSLSEADFVTLSVEEIQRSQSLRDRWKRDIYNRFREAKKRFRRIFSLLRVALRFAPRIAVFYLFSSPHPARHFLTAIDSRFSPSPSF